MTAGTAPKFLVTAGAYEDLPPMEIPGTAGFIGDTYANPDGSAMCCGYFRLEPSDTPLLYSYEYDEMKVVLSGSFVLKNVDTGQTEVANQFDALFFPKGSNIEFSTPSGALAFYTGHRDASLL